MLLVGGATVGANVAGNNIPLRTQIDDSSLKIKAVQSINDIPEIAKTSHVEIAVYDRIVLVLGQTPSMRLKHEVARKISAIQGVRLVYNELTIGPRISYTNYLNDGLITSAVKGNLIGKVDSLHFKVITENHVVYLMALTTQEAGQKAAEIASNTKGVERVVKVYSFDDPSQPADFSSKPKAPVKSKALTSDDLPVPEL